MGIKLPGYFIEAGIGAPHGTDVTGHLLPMRVSADMLAAVYRSVLPLALKHGVTTEECSGRFFEEIRQARVGTLKISAHDSKRLMTQIPPAYLGRGVARKSKATRSSSEGNLL